MLRFCKADVESLHKAWGCNAGPCALAACLGIPLSAVRRLIPEFGMKGYVSRSMMRSALAHAGYEPRIVPSAEPDEGDRYPDHGLCRIQFGGSWINGPNARGSWAILNSHWVASKQHEGVLWVFDFYAGYWMPWAEWNVEIVPLAIGGLRAPKLADGEFWPIDSWEVRRYRGESCKPNNSANQQPGGTKAIESRSQPARL